MICVHNHTFHLFVVVCLFVCLLITVVLFLHVSFFSWYSKTQKCLFYHGIIMMVSVSLAKIITSKYVPYSG